MRKALKIVEESVTKINTNVDISTVEANRYKSQAIGQLIGYTDFEGFHLLYRGLPILGSQRIILDYKVLKRTSPHIALIKLITGDSGKVNSNVLLGEVVVTSRQSSEARKRFSIPCCKIFQIISNNIEQKRVDYNCIPSKKASNIA